MRGKIINIKLGESSSTVLAGLCIGAGSTMGFFSLFNSTVGPGQTNGVVFICITIGFVGALVVVSIKGATSKIVSAIEKLKL